MTSSAVFVSKVFNPVVFATLSVLVAISQTSLSAQAKALWFLAAFLAILVPYSFLHLQYKRGKVSDLWSPKMEERRQSVIVWLAGAGIFSAIAYFFSAPRLVLSLGLVFLVLGLLNLVFGSYMKLSVHSEAVTVFVLTAMLSVSVLYISLTILILLVTWARVHLKAHTLSEVTFGTLAALLAVYFVFNYFGLVTF